MNIVEVLSQISETTKKVVGQINFDGMASALKIVAEQLKPLESNHYFMVIDSLSVNKQGHDVGIQYRTGIIMI